MTPKYWRNFTGNAIQHPGPLINLNHNPAACIFMGADLFVQSIRVEMHSETLIS